MSDYISIFAIILTFIGSAIQLWELLEDKKGAEKIDNMRQHVNELENFLDSGRLSKPDYIINTIDEKHAELNMTYREIDDILNDGLVKATIDTRKKINSQMDDISNFDKKRRYILRLSWVFIFIGLSLNLMEIFVKAYPFPSKHTKSLMPTDTRRFLVF